MQFLNKLQKILPKKLQNAALNLSVQSDGHLRINSKQVDTLLYIYGHVFRQVVHIKYS